jgi:signal transduction histidine kinase
MVRSSSKSIIKDHGGKIWAEVNLGGESAMFSFSSSLRKYKI